MTRQSAESDRIQPTFPACSRLRFERTNRAATFPDPSANDSRTLIALVNGAELPSEICASFSRLSACCCIASYRPTFSQSFNRVRGIHFAEEPKRTPAFRSTESARDSCERNEVSGATTVGRNRLFAPRFFKIMQRFVANAACHSLYRLSPRCVHRGFKNLNMGQLPFPLDRAPTQFRLGPFFDLYAPALALNPKHLSFFSVPFSFVNNVDKNREKVRRYKGVYGVESRGVRFADTRTVVRDPTGSANLLHIYDKSRRLDQSWRRSYRQPTAGSSFDCSFNRRDYKRTIYKVPSRGPSHGNYSLIAPLFPNFRPVRGNCTNNSRIWKHPLL